MTCACTMLRKATRAVARVYDEALAGHGMTTAQFSILRKISRAQPLALSRLAEQLEMDRSSLYRALAPLEKLGWVTVRAGSGRTKLATLTPAGHAAMTGAEPDWEKVQGRVEAGMGSELLRGLDLGLQALVRSAEGGRA
ncbi:MarR family transcriptional regulator [Sphingomonas sp. R-74633]|nr:MarR family transcriptional regulator [Sphingomonas sp. R-74633]